MLVIDFRKVPQRDKDNDVRMGIYSKEMDADEFHALQRDPMSMWKLFKSIIEDYDREQPEETAARRKCR